jgi:hyperosmotically inducible protein
MINFSRSYLLIYGVASLAFLAVSFRVTANPQTQTEPKTVDPAKVHLRLAKLPGYSVFDNMSAKINGSKVTLTGQVVDPKLRSNAEAVIKRVEGVTRVQNDVELLPSSSSDEELRRATYRAIYSDPALARYRYSELPLIHIIVSGGNVSLEGMVYDESDFAVVGLRAKGVPNVSSVKNNLAIENRVAP